MEEKLQPLRIPAGWMVDYNQFFDEDVTKENVEESYNFKEDILQFSYPQRDRIIDLGWYPEFNWKKGSFRLVVYEGDFHGTLLHTFKSRDKSQIVNEINRVLLDITQSQL